MRTVITQRQRISARRSSARACRVSQSVSGTRRELRKTQSRTAFYLAVLFLFFTLSFQLWVRISIFNKRYEIAKLRSEALQADSELRELQVVYAVQAKPATILQRSKGTLGLDTPHPRQVRRVAYTVF